MKTRSQVTDFKISAEQSETEFNEKHQEKMITDNKERKKNGTDDKMENYKHRFPSLPESRAFPRYIP